MQTWVIIILIAKIWWAPTMCQAWFSAPAITAVMKKELPTCRTDENVQEWIFCRVTAMQTMGVQRWERLWKSQAMSGGTFHWRIGPWRIGRSWTGREERRDPPEQNQTLSGWKSVGRVHQWIVCLLWRSIWWRENCTSIWRPQIRHPKNNRQQVWRGGGRRSQGSQDCQEGQRGCFSPSSREFQLDMTEECLLGLWVWRSLGTFARAVSVSVSLLSVGGEVKGS